MLFLQKHFLPFLLLLLATHSHLLLAQVERGQTSVINLKPQAFKSEMKKGVILDVRTPEEYARGHLPGAINLNYKDSQFQEYTKALKPNTSYFVYCAVGGRSAQACKFLKANGFTQVYNLDGGITAWQQAGQSIVP